MLVSIMQRSFKMFEIFKKKEEEIKENKAEIAYRMMKEKKTIEEIMENLNLNKMEVVDLIQMQKKIRRGE